MNEMSNKTNGSEFVEELKNGTFKKNHKKSCIIIKNKGK